MSIIIERTPREAMRENWRRARPPLEVMATKKPEPLRLNGAAVLDLGNVVYYHFRGREYGVPPVSHRAAERIQRARVELEALGETITAENLKPYYKLFRQLSRLVWRSMYPAGRFRRALRFLGAYRNPFRSASEAEIRDAALFLLARRLKTGMMEIPRAKDAPSAQ